MFSERLKKLRKQSGMSQASLAKELFVSQQAVARWETDKATPNPETLARLVELFGVSADELLGTQNTKKAPSHEDADLSSDEAALLTDFRKLTKDQKAFVLQAVKAEAIRKADVPFDDHWSVSLAAVLFRMSYAPLPFTEHSFLYLLIIIVRVFHFVKQKYRNVQTGLAERIELL